MAPRSFLTLLLLAALLPACGGEVTDAPGGGGAGGSGGAGGAGGTGGTGAGGAGSCSPQLQDAVTLNPPPVGFDADPSGPGTAVIVGVDAAGLDLSLGPDAPPIRFHWVGPDLADTFAMGETVDVGIGVEWHFVTGANSSAATIRTFDFVAPDALPEIPGGGPTIGFSAQCTFPEAGGGCGEPPGTIAVLAVEGTFNDTTTAISYGETGAVGPWRIHNAGAFQLPGYGSEDCVVEAAFVAVVSSLGPIPPP